MSDTVKVETRGRVLEVTLDRPKANAIDAPTSQEMGRVFCEFRDNPDLRVAIVTGGGEKFFSAGWDLKAAAEGEDYDADNGPGGFAGLTELHDLNKPLIAAVNGMAVGGGFELALSCDMILAADHASSSCRRSMSACWPTRRPTACPAASPITSPWKCSSPAAACRRRRPGAGAWSTRSWPPTP